MGTIGVEPELDVTGARNYCTGTIFKTIKDAEACIKKNAIYTDAAGCRPTGLELISTPAQPNDCTSEHVIQVRPLTYPCSLIYIAYGNILYSHLTLL